MKIRLASTFVAAAAAFATGCASAPGGMVTGTAPDDPNVARVALALDRYAESMRAMDSERIVATFEEDGAILGPDTPGIKGRPAIRESLESLQGFKVLDHRFRVKATHLDGGVATQDGDFEQSLSTPEGGQVRAHGDFQAVWDRQPDGGWLLRFVYAAPVIDERP